MDDAGGATAGGRRAARALEVAEGAPLDGLGARGVLARAHELCLRWLAVRPHTRAELASKLDRRGLPEPLTEAVLVRLTEVGLIDDEAFAGAWVSTRQRGRGLARRALAHELRQRGVAAETVERAVAAVSADDERTAARALVARRLASTPGLAPQVRQRRLAAVLARRGYGCALAAEVVREALDGESAVGPQAR